MRLFYYYPTWDRPSGGNKQLRLQATLLREAGVDTFLIRDAAFFTRLNSFDDNELYGVSVETAPVPFEQASQFLRPDDVLILPEVRLNDWLAKCAGWNVRIAVNNQNGFYGLRYGAPRALASQRIEFVIANAPYVAALSRHFYGVSPRRIFHVPHWMVRPPFEIDPTAPPGALSVSYMPRKLPELVAEVRRRVQRERPDVPWVEIDGIPEPEVARRMRKSSVFFAAQDLEGCPLTALEAMTCNALVAGYPGTARFPHPYTAQDNGFWARDRDIAGAVTAVGHAIDLARTGGEAYRNMLQAGYSTARRFGKEAVAEAVRDLVSTVGNQSYGNRRGPRPSLGANGWLQAARVLYDADKLGRTGQLAGKLAGTVKRLRGASTS